MWDAVDPAVDVEGHLLPAAFEDQARRKPGCAAAAAVAAGARDRLAANPLDARARRDP